MPCLADPSCLNAGQEMPQEHVHAETIPGRHQDEPGDDRPDPLGGPEGRDAISFPQSGSGGSAMTLVTVRSPDTKNAALPNGALSAPELSAASLGERAEIVAATA